MNNSMPTWIIIYLIIYCVFSWVALCEEKHNSRSKIVMISNLMSPFIIIYFSIIYFTKVSQLATYIAIPIFIIGLLLEFKSASIELQYHKENPDPELTKTQNLLMDNIGLLINNLLTVPGYIIGVMLIFNVF